MKLNKFVHICVCILQKMLSVEHSNHAYISLDMWKSDLGKIHNLIPGNFSDQYLTHLRSIFIEKTEELVYVNLIYLLLTTDLLTMTV